MIRSTEGYPDDKNVATVESSIYTHTKLKTS